MTRAEYIDGYHGGEEGAKLHREYYGQFVTDRVKRCVLQTIGQADLVASKDEHMNDIPLKRWDAVMPLVHADIAAKMRLLGDYPTPAGTVCIVKEAAKQILESL